MPHDKAGSGMSQQTRPVTLCLRWLQLTQCCHTLGRPREAIKIRTKGDTSSLGSGFDPRRTAPFLGMWLDKKGICFARSLIGERYPSSPPI